MNRVSPCEAEDEIAGLPDVDVVPGDVVEEQQALARGQGIQVRLQQILECINLEQYG